MVREHLGPLLPHELLLYSQLGVRIQSRHEIAISLQEARRQHAGMQVRPQAIGYCSIRQIGLFKDLPVRPRVLGKKALELDNQANLFIHDFENLLS
jgi:hypothetical protein